MHALRRYAEALAKTDAPALITGESGSGKETIARLIHALSRRAAGPFLTITCAGMPVDALEQELFGTASAGFAHRHSGRGELKNCQDATLFLSDIVDMPSANQAQLVHILRKRQFFRSGSNTPTDANVRILTATGSPLESTLTEQKLRNDLYYSVSAFVLHVPPLRDRREDIPCLIEHFLQREANRFDLPARRMSCGTMRACEVHFWPGNVRQLQNVIRQYALVGDEELVRKSVEQDPTTCNQQTDNEPRLWEQRPGLKSVVRVVRDKTENDLIASALEQTGWNRKMAAQLLNISYRSLLYKIEEYHLSPHKEPPMAG